MREQQPTVEVSDNAELSRYEGRIGAELAAVLEYRIEGARVAFTHAETRPEWEGKGVSSQVAKAALDATVASGRSIAPLCAFVRDYVQRHPEYQDHIA